MMEIVFHDVPTPPGGYILDIETLREQNLVVSRIRPKRRLQTVDLSAKGLKRLGLHRSDLVDTPVTVYPRTREWAAWFHGATPSNGLLWTSRRDDTQSSGSARTRVDALIWASMVGMLL